MSDIIREIEAEQMKAAVDEFAVGDTVKVYGKIKEGNRERIQVFEGVVLKRQGGSSRETFTVRKTSNGIGMGILIKRIKVPVSTGIRRFRIMAMPVTPPGARELGSRNRLTATE